MIDILYYKYAHSPIQHIICYRNVFTNFLPFSHSINPTNETCLVACATWLMYAVFHLIYPSTRIRNIILCMYVHPYNTLISLHISWLLVTGIACLGAFAVSTVFSISPNCFNLRVSTSTMPYFIAQMLMVTSF